MINDLSVSVQAKAISDPFAYQSYRKSKIREKIEEDRTNRVQLKVSSISGWLQCWLLIHLSVLLAVRVVSSVIGSVIHFTELLLSSKLKIYGLKKKVFESRLEHLMNLEPSFISRACA